MPKLSIIIPTLDEGQNIPELFRRIFKVRDARNAQIIIVDGGSSDNTCDEVRHVALSHKNVELLTAPEGKGIALRLGFSKARASRIIFMDGDLQYSPADLPKVIRALTRYDLVATKRKSAPLDHRLLLSLGFSQVIGKGLLSLPVSDPQSGMKGIRSSLLKRLTLASRNWEIDAELICKAQAAGAKIKEVEISFHQRDAGKSKTSLVPTSANLLGGALRLAAKR